ncbi:MAG: tetratricopeptide repeat protein [Myxococcota bacterium]|nr:tetratricopeptide repeat protein [Myxococcota bacterium]
MIRSVTEGTPTALADIAPFGEGAHPSRSCWEGAPRARGAIGMVALLLLALACSSPETQLQDTLARAEQYRKDSNPQAEIIELRAALKLQPNRAETNLLIGQFYKRLEQPDEAAFYFGEAYRLDPELSEAGVQQADLLKFEDLEQAEQIVEEILARDPGHAGANRQRAELRLVSMDLAEALTAALTAAEIAPDDPAVQVTLGRVHQSRIIEARKIKGEEPADDIFQSAIDAFEKAEAGYEGVEERLPVVLEIAKVYESWPGHVEEAKDAHRRVNELAGDSHRAYRYRAAIVAVAFATRIQDEEFLRWALERVIEVQPEDVRNWRRLAKAMDDFDGTGDAIYERLLSEQPDNIAAHESYADFLAAKGEGDRAVAHLDQLEGDGLDPARIRKKLAFTHLDLVDKESAEAVVADLEARFPDDPSMLIARGRLHMINLRFDDARADFDRVNAGGGDAEALLYVAELERRLGDTGAAIRALDRSQELSPDVWPERIRERARVAAQARDYAQVDQLMRGLVEIGLAPTRQDQFLWSDALYAIGQEGRGRFILLRLLSKGNRFGAAMRFARHEGDNRPDEARKYLEEGIAKRPGNRRLLVTYARFETRQGNGERALELLDQAIAGSPRMAPARALRARLHAGEGNWEQAEKDAFDAFQINPQVPGLTGLLVRIYAERDKLDEITASLAEADAAGALSPDARALLGMLQVRKGDTQAAMASLDKAISEGAAAPLAKNNLAYLLAQEKKDLSRALELAQEAQDDLGDSSTITDTIGYIYHQRGLHESAVTTLKAALELAEDEGSPAADIRYHLGLALDALGRTEEAVAEYEAALDLDPDFYASKDARAALEKARASL